ncbi:MAG TPA: hypothetical protein DEU72_00620 [Desulfomicrobiaceae bacterium]|nr:hypothetical protein [Desulfomicrobiaceae bacterium]
MVTRRELLLGLVRRVTPKSPLSGLDAEVRAADAAFASGDFALARERYRAVLRTQRDHHEARVRLGICFYKLGEFLQAKDTLAMAVRHRPADPLARAYLGLSYAQRGQVEKALAAWEGFMDPDNISLTREINLWRALAESGEPVDVPAMVAAVEPLLG